MTPITTSIEIARPAEEVFAYVTDPTTFPEWQQGVVSGHMDAPTTRVDSKCTMIRRIGTGHGIGKLLVPLIVRRQAAGGMPESLRRLKQRLELRHVS